MLLRRLGLESARIPHADRAGLLWLSRGTLSARDGTLAFARGGEAAPDDPLGPGDYAIPLQGVSMILLGPGQSFVLDVADLFRDTVTIPAAFSRRAPF